MSNKDKAKLAAEIAIAVLSVLIGRSKRGR